MKTQASGKKASRDKWQRDEHELMKALDRIDNRSVRNNSLLQIERLCREIVGTNCAQIDASYDC